MMKKSPSHWSLGRTCSGLRSITWCNHKNAIATSPNWTLLGTHRHHSLPQGWDCQFQLRAEPVPMSF
jgi:hypothetical protein